MKTFKIWYGESDIATLVNHAGSWVQEDGLIRKESRMFDNDPNTFWHADGDTFKEKIIGVEFKVIHFLTFVKVDENPSYC